MHFSISLSLLALSSLPLLPQAAPAKKPKVVAPKFNYGTNPVYGVNLGGWFVLEPWITPSIFEEWTDNQEVVDEWTFCQVLGATEAKTRLEQHWSTWYTQQDFQNIAAAGLNHVRIPIGYWSIVPRAGDPFVQGAYAWLKKACDWAEAAGLNVMIDLHGAPSSQNGFDNSGHKTSDPLWAIQNGTIPLTLQSIQKLKNDFAKHPAVTTVELVNEPQAGRIGQSVIESYYNAGDAIFNNTGVAVTFHDGFLPTVNWNSWGAGLYDLVEDTHHYQMFSNSAVARTPAQQVTNACAQAGPMTNTNKPTICGEWCGAMTDCAYWLNGLGVGARYDGTYPNSTYVGSCAGLSNGTVAALPAATQVNIRKYIEAQLDTYQKGAGWIFWTWKNEGAPEWHMEDLIANGVFPQPLSDRQYPGQCSS